MTWNENNVLKEEHISTGSKNKNKKPVFTKVALLKKFSGEKTFSIFALCCVVEWWFWKRKMQAIKWQMFGQCQIKCWQQVCRQFKHCCGPIVIMVLSFIISGKPTKSQNILLFCCWTWKKNQVTSSAFYGWLVAILAGLLANRHYTKVVNHQRKSTTLLRILFSIFSGQQSYRSIAAGPLFLNVFYVGIQHIYHQRL